MKTAIILHGMPSKNEYYNPERPSQSNSHWIPWIQHQLLLNNILAQTPELPHPYQPNYEDWKQVFEQFNIDKETTLVGHSCGAGFLIRYLSENNIKVGKVALVAPWIDPNKDEAPEFFDFLLDKNLIDKVTELCIFYSTDDHEEILETVKILKDNLPNIEIKEFTNKGHFCFDDLKTDQFPGLLEYLI